MDNISLFRHEGEARIHTRLEPRLDKTLLDIIWLAARKVGFDEDQSQQIAITFFDPILERMNEFPDSNPPEADLWILHSPGKMQLKCEVNSLNLLLDRTYTL